VTEIAPQMIYEFEVLSYTLSYPSGELNLHVRALVEKNGEKRWVPMTIHTKVGAHQQ
jgi:hypothetical protein